MTRLHVLALAALTMVGVLLSAGSAAAATTDPFVYQRSFASDLGVNLGQIAVNYATGNVLVVGGGQIHQYDASGEPVDFTATGTPTIPAGQTLIVDNSGGPTQGNIYTAAQEFGGFLALGYKAYHADGSPIGEGAGGPGTFAPNLEEHSETFGGFFGPCGLAVDADGNLWLGDQSGNITQMSPTAVPTGPQGHMEKPGGTWSSCAPLVFDDLGNVYHSSVERFEFEAPEMFTYVGNTGLPGVLGERSPAVDPATHDIYAPIDTAGQEASSGFKGWVYAVPYTDPPEEQTPYEAFSAKYGLRTAHAVGFDATGQTLYLVEANRVDVFHREPPSPPKGIGPLAVKQVRTGGAVLTSSLEASGAPVTYHFEYGLDTSYGQSSEPLEAPFNYFSIDISDTLRGLQPDTTYHARLVATNSAGTTYGPDRTFKTYGLAPGGLDPCANALARKQTFAQRLPDCRAYELVSARDTGGFDVESHLAPGQTPFPGFPLAHDKVLYATHSGAVPGPWHATNKGPDPYLATRGDGGWSTDYRGLPSDINPAAGSFSSEVGEADSSLGTLAFAGPNLCDPCFTDGGLETGIPLRLADGQLLQGMAGSLDDSVPTDARPEGGLSKFFSGDGRHLVFASKYAFEPGANTGGDLTVYDRNLAAGTTQIVSTDENGAALTGTVSELDVSDDGSRIVTAKQIAVDGEGNEYTHPYMHIGSSAESVDLAPGTTSGVLFAGMTEDGSRVFFTTPDKLVSGDTDASADLYEAAVDPSGNVNLSILTPGSSDSCNPVANENGEHWSSADGAANCSAVAIAGGGGVASASGAIYFLSPEDLDGSGTPNEPNLYLAAPGGDPHFVATLAPNDPLVLDSVKSSSTRRTGDFQTTPSGGFATFVSKLRLEQLDNHELASVYRYDGDSGQIDCASCDRTETNEAQAFAPAELPPNGLALLEDGRLFFTTKAQLVLNDANGKRDVYEFVDGKAELISSGNGPFDSGLLTASADGTDAFFFTQDNLVPREDSNRSLMRIYDAREGGGFFKLPEPVPCQAADECHGPGTVSPPPPDIRSSGKTTRGNPLVCPKHRVKRHGKCVKKHRHRKKHAKRLRHRKGHAKTTGKRGG